MPGESNRTEITVNPLSITVAAIGKGKTGAALPPPAPW